MMYLDLEELSEVFNGKWFWSTSCLSLARFKREDHMGDHSKDLATCIRELVFNESGLALTGPVRVLTNLRYFGYIFNPVSLYFCFDKTGQEVQAIVAEVNNTPWRERHCYVVTEFDTTSHSIAKDTTGEQLTKSCPTSNRATTKHCTLPKKFHVSPFMGMNMQYEWHFTTPGEFLTIQMRNFQDNEHVFDATLQLKAHPITSSSLAKSLLRFPFLTAKITAAIYYEAFNLWRKRTPYFAHPLHATKTDSLSKNKTTTK